MLHPDATLIDRLGGPTKLAQTLGYDKTRGGVQRVQNWRHRGIPSAVKVNHPALLMPELIGIEGAPPVPEKVEA